MLVSARKKNNWSNQDISLKTLHARMLVWWIMQPGNIEHRIGRHISRGFMHISWETSSCWGRARYACPIAVGHFLPARRSAGSFEGEGRKEGRKSRDVGEVPEAAAEKIGSRYRRRRPSPPPLPPPKTIAPTLGAIAGFIPTFCRVILFNAASDSSLRLNYSNSVLRSFPVTRPRRKPRAHASPLYRPPRLSGDFHPVAISHCVFRLAAAVYTDATC